MQRFAVVLSSLVLFTAAARAQEGTREFFPTAIGTEWVFSAGEVELIERIADHEEVNGERCLRIETVLNGRVVAHEHIAVRQDGIYRVSIAGTLVEPPLCFLKYTARLGDHWDVRSKVNDSEISGRFTLGQKTIQLPAGEFRAVTAEGTDFTSGEATLDFTYYFVEGLGKVQQIIQAGDQEAVMALKEFRPAKR